MTETKRPIPFDSLGAKNINEARMEFMDTFLPDLIAQTSARTAHDIGCGVGYFSNYLSKFNLQLRGTDFREENIVIAKSRFPDFKFSILDVENIDTEIWGSDDLVLCTGLLYHLENPFLAIRNLIKITNKFIVIESMIFPMDIVGAALINEGLSPDQGSTYFALVPTEQCLINMLYFAKFPYVYKPTTCPNHSDFIENDKQSPIRIFLIASKEELHHKLLSLQIKEVVGHNTLHIYRFKK